MPTVAVPEIQKTVGRERTRGWKKRRGEKRKEENVREAGSEGEKETIVCMCTEIGQERKEQKGRDRSLERKRGLGLVFFVPPLSRLPHTNERKENKRFINMLGCLAARRLFLFLLSASYFILIRSLAFRRCAILASALPHRNQAVIVIVPGKTGTTTSLYIYPLIRGKKTKLATQA